MEKTVTIGGTKYRAVLPVEGRWHTLTAPPAGSGDGEQASRWANLAPGAWGENASDPVIEAIGVILEGAALAPRWSQRGFAGQWSIASWRLRVRRGPRGVTPWRKL